MQGLYIHIPFCKRACHYCDFHFSTSLKYKPALLQALNREMELRKDYFPRAQLSTVYFGGGTPSLLDAGELEALLATIHKNFVIEPGAEITLEANPDDITAQKVKDFKRAGINRLSIGIQSFFGEDLAWMNRAHNAAQANACLQIARDAGIENLNADLIYGYPLLSDEKWEANMEKIFLSGAGHLSAYSLTVEPKTALATRIKQGKDIAPVSGQAARHFEMLMDAIAARGWEHYEISNYCRPGNYALHNTSYWKNHPYLGIGPSAHSYNGQARQWNIANNAAYMQAIETGQLPQQTETLTNTDLLNEYIMTGLRTQWGIDTAHIQQRFGQQAGAYVLEQAGAFIEKKLLNISGSTITLSRAGKLMADAITAELFMIT